MKSNPFASVCRDAVAAGLGVAVASLIAHFDRTTLWVVPLFLAFQWASGRYEVSENSVRANVITLGGLLGLVVSGGMLAWRAGSTWNAWLAGLAFAGVAGGTMMLTVGRRKKGLLVVGKAVHARFWMVDVRDRKDLLGILDDEAPIGRTVDGVPVLGPSGYVGDLLATGNCREVIILRDEREPGKYASVVEACWKQRVPVRMVRLTMPTHAVIETEVSDRQAA